MLIHIRNDDELLAIIVKASYSQEKTTFLTEESYSQQLAYMRLSKGKGIMAHVHKKYTRTIQDTLEALIIKKGKMRIDFYDTHKNYLKSHILETGDVILLLLGGHGFEAIEETEFIEVKQGPYAGDNDKVKFSGHQGEKRFE